jgi:hypothetical protein
MLLLETFPGKITDFFLFQDLGTGVSKTYIHWRASYKRRVVGKNNKYNKYREISGSLGGEYEDGCLLGCCAM